MWFPTWIVSGTRVLTFSLCQKSRCFSMLTQFWYAICWICNQRPSSCSHCLLSQLITKPTASYSNTCLHLPPMLPLKHQPEPQLLRSAGRTPCWHPSHWILGIWGIWFWASERLQPQPCYFHKSTDFWSLTFSLTTPALEPVQKSMSHRNFARLVQSRRSNTPREILCFTIMFPVVSSFSFDGKWVVQYFFKTQPIYVTYWWFFTIQ